MALVPTPQMIGVHDVAELWGCTPDRIRRRIRARHRPTLTGYFGKIGGRHIWNAHELFSQVFSTDVALDDVIRTVINRTPVPVEQTVICGVDDCGGYTVFAGLCTKHLRRFMRAWYHSASSHPALLQFVGMCRWVVDRNAHLVLPAGFDPFSTVCMTPGCGNSTNVHGGDGWHSPLCQPCTAKFWNNPPLRPKPDFWRPPKQRKAA